VINKTINFFSQNCKGKPYLCSDKIDLVIKKIAESLRLQKNAFFAEWQSEFGLDLCKSCLTLSSQNIQRKNHFS
jgi:hypothetical protein